MYQETLRKNYGDALKKLAEMLSLQYEEVLNFCGQVQDGAYGARRLKEFFRGPDVVEQLDSIVRISEEYQGLSGLQTAEHAACE